MVKVQNWVTEPEIITVLNREPPGPSAYVRFVEAYWKGGNANARLATETDFCSDLRDWKSRQSKIGRAAFTTNYLASAPYFKPPPATSKEGWRLPETISTEQGWLIGAALTSAHLRTLVDAWLETGRDSNGSEQPSLRNLLKTRRGWGAVSEFIAQSPPKMSPSIDPTGFGLILAAPDWSHPWAADFFEAQEVTANRLFVGIMASDWQQRLCKCRYLPCGRYFIGSKLRHCYRHGTFCTREHRGRASAEAITKARRSHGQSCLIDAAAQWLTKMGCSATWPNDHDLKRRLAEFLSKRTLQNPTLRAGRELVRVNWVTRNRVAIEQRQLELSGRDRCSSRR